MNLLRIAAFLGGNPVFCKEFETFNQDSQLSHDNLELKQVQIFFRHGARTPLHIIDMKESIPKDIWEPHLILNRSLSFCKFPYQVVDLQGNPLPQAEISLLEGYYQSMTLLGGTAVGQLTRQGHEQMFQLGQRYRHRYTDKMNFIHTDENLEDALYLRSSRVNRNIFSLQCVLAGLFEGVDFTHQQNVLKIHSAKSEQEIFYPNSRHCKAQRKFLLEGKEKLKNHTEIINSETHVKELLGVKELWSQLRKTKCSLHTIRNIFVSRQYHGFVIPKEISNYLPEMSRLVSEEMIYELFGGPLPEYKSTLRFNVGPVLDMILKRFEEVQRGNFKTKLCLYATHDSLIIPILVFLDAFNYEYPRYGEDIIFEVYRDSTTGQYWIQILHNGKALEFDGVKTIGNGCYVPLSYIIDKVKEYAVPYELYRSKCEEESYPDQKGPIANTTIIGL